MSDDTFGVVFLVWPPLLSETLLLSSGDLSLPADAVLVQHDLPQTTLEQAEHTHTVYLEISCSKIFISCHNIFVDWATHKNFITATSLTRLRKKYEGPAARLARVYPEPWEAAVGQELVNENLGTPQTGTCVRYGSKERNDYRTLTAARKVSRVCSLFLRRQSLGCR